MRAFVPNPLPPSSAVRPTPPNLAGSDEHRRWQAGRHRNLVAHASFFTYRHVRKRAVLSARIERPRLLPTLWFLSVRRSQASRSMT